MASQLKKIDMGEWAMMSDADLTATPHNDIVGGPCTLHHVAIENTAGDEDVHLKLYDSVDVTVGTDDPVETIFCDGTSGAHGGERSMQVNPPDGLDFATGLSIAATTEAGTAGTTNPTNDLQVSLLVKE